MKHLKKITAMLLAVLMVMSLATTVMADENPQTPEPTKLIITGAENRTFEVYKLMDASIAGTNYSYSIADKYLEILQSVSGKETEAEILDYLEDMTNNGSEIRTFADAVYRAIQAKSLTEDAKFTGTQKELDQGYYLVADVTELGTTPDAANSLVLLGTMGESSITVALKAEVPTLVKKVDDENDSIMGEDLAGNEDGTSWEDTADYDIGDRVPYRIAMEMPNDISNYEYYAIVMTDVLSEGLTFLPETFKIYVNGTEWGLAEASEPGDAKFLYQIDGQTLYVYPNAGYEGKAASGANGGDAKKIGIANNDNIVFRYSCELNEDAVVGNPGNPNHAWLTYSNDPYGDSFGKTVEDYCIVFTYMVNINKVDAERAALAGAEFELYKFVASAEGTEESHGSTGDWALIDNVTVNEAGTKFSFSGLDDGHYKLVEKTAPKGYNPIDPICFHVTAKHLAQLNGEQTDALRELNYTIDVSGSISFTMDTAEGSFTADVVNKSGSILPSTGGMGTTLFYIVGGIMVLAAVVLLVTKKRMAGEK